MRISERLHEFHQRSPQLINVLGGFRKVIGKIDFGVRHSSELVDRQLKTVLILVEQPFDLQKVFLLEGVDGVFHVVPHLGFDLSATVGESQREIRLTGLFWLYLFYGDDEAGSDYLVLKARTIREEEILHVFRP